MYQILLSLKSLELYFLLRIVEIDPSIIIFSIKMFELILNSRKWVINENFEFESYKVESFFKNSTVF